ncbi:leucyl aminopeptidase [Candidatus Scalindua japonica]|uniref:Leucyl aminopeptidase n=1 Tax=Candidatus Scalindua japonica TaxID=1284222 RepID=A0A286U156_9BACT|nr:hypothetical protein [Candidatus Scalindua japonica]GAX61858.1 leucyl aminopeptidase [Candidatus Scalindua japonica]
MFGLLYQALVLNYALAVYSVFVTLSRYMQYSETDAIAIIERFKKRPIIDLDTLFNRGIVPVYKDVAGETAGAILALNPENPWWLTWVIKITFKSTLGKWTGKKFITPFYKEKKGYGINLFNSRNFPQYFKFDTYIKNAYVDGKPSLALDYRPYHLCTIGLVDEVRKIKDGQCLGRAYYIFPWRRQAWFVGYFVLCNLGKDFTS